MKDYGDVLGRLVCMYLQMINEESEIEWEHGLTEEQLLKLNHINECLELNDDNEEELDQCFHALLKELFLWHETHKLMEELECPIHRFLIYASVDHSAKGFISVRE